MPDYWWFFSVFEFLTSWFCELTKLQGLGEKMCSVSMSSHICVTGRYLFPSSTAHSISWENQKGFVPVILKGKKSYWNIWSYSLWVRHILLPKLQEVALYQCRSNIWSRGISCILKCHNSLGKIGSEQLISFKNSKTSPTLKLFKIIANLLTSDWFTWFSCGFNCNYYYNCWSRYSLAFNKNKTDEHWFFRFSQSFRNI